MQSGPVLEASGRLRPAFGTNWLARRTFQPRTAAAIARARMLLTPTLRPPCGAVVLVRSHRPFVCVALIARGRLDVWSGHTPDQYSQVMCLSASADESPRRSPPRGSMMMHVDDVILDAKEESGDHSV